MTFSRSEMRHLTDEEAVQIARWQNEVDRAVRAFRGSDQTDTDAAELVRRLRAAVEKGYDPDAERWPGERSETQ